MLGSKSPGGQLALSLTWGSWDTVGAAPELPTWGDRRVVSLFTNSLSLLLRTCSQELHLQATLSFLHTGPALLARKVTSFFFIKKPPVYMHRVKHESWASHQEHLLRRIFSSPQNVISHREVSKWDSVLWRSGKILFNFIKCFHFYGFKRTCIIHGQFFFYKHHNQSLRSIFYL